MSAGKGSKPRSCFSKEFKNNFDEIDWSKNLKETNNVNWSKDKSSCLENKIKNLNSNNSSSNESNTKYNF